MANLRRATPRHDVVSALHNAAPEPQIINLKGLTCLSLTGLVLSRELFDSRDTTVATGV